MLDLNRDIHPLTDFKRNTAAFLEQLRETGEPVVLTINGKAELVVQDARSYQKLRRAGRATRNNRGRQDEGLASMRRGEGRPMDEVFDRLEEELRTKARK